GGVNMGVGGGGGGGGWLGGGGMAGGGGGAGAGGDGLVRGERDGGRAASQCGAPARRLPCLARRQARPPRGDRAGRLRADGGQRAGAEDPFRQAAGRVRQRRQHGGARETVRPRRRDPDRPGALTSVRAAAGRRDWTAVPVMAAGVLGAIYLIGVPLVMLTVAALRGPADLLPFEPGARWTLEHVGALVDDPVILSRILPDTLVFVA